MSVCPVASHTRTPVGIGIIAGAPEHSGHGQGLCRRPDCRRARDSRPQARFRSVPHQMLEHWSPWAAENLPRPGGRRRLQLAERPAPHDRVSPQEHAASGIPGSDQYRGGAPPLSPSPRAPVSPRRSAPSTHSTSSGADQRRSKSPSDERTRGYPRCLHRGYGSTTKTARHPLANKAALIGGVPRLAHGRRQSVHGPFSMQDDPDDERDRHDERGPMNGDHARAWIVQMSWFRLFGQRPAEFKWIPAGLR